MDDALMTKLRSKRTLVLCCCRFRFQIQTFLHWPEDLRTSLWVWCVASTFDRTSSMRKVGSRLSARAKRGGLIKSIPPDARIIEIGPFGNPAVRGKNVSYFDVLDTEELRARAAEQKLQKINHAMRVFEEAGGNYIDVHAW